MTKTAPELGQRLDARGYTGRIAKDFSGRIHHHRPAVDADAGDQVRAARASVFEVQFGQRALDGQRGANSAFAIVLLRNRVAKQRQEPVAELLGDASAHLRHRLRGGVEVGAEQIAPNLNVESGCKCGRADKIAEHDRDRAAFSGIELRRRGESGRRQPTSG